MRRLPRVTLHASLAILAQFASVLLITWYIGLPEPQPAAGGDFAKRAP
jgi:hypothetical protein